MNFKYKKPLVNSVDTTKAGTGLNRSRLMVVITFKRKFMFLYRNITFELVIPIEFAMRYLGILR